MEDVMVPDSNDPMKNRRRMAWISFYVLLSTLSVVVLFIALGDEDARANLDAAEFLVGAVIACLTGLVAQYMHQSYVRDKDKNL